MSSDSREDEQHERADESAVAALDSASVRATELTRAARRLAVSGCACFAGILVWAVVVDGPRQSLTSVVVKGILFLAGGVFLAFAMRGAAQMRRELVRAARIAGEQMQKLEGEAIEARESKQRASEASAATSELFADISHELQASLQSITRILQSAIDTEMSAERARPLELARRSAQQVLSTAEAVLDFTNTEDRHLEVEPVYFSIRELFADALEPLGIEAAEKGLILAYAVAGEVPDRLWGDPKRLRRIVVNLTANAIKFASHGEVVVRMVCEAMSASAVTTVIEVSDTGAGIDPLVRPLLFDRSAARRRHAGSGLGLAVVSRLLEVMGGTITVESEPAKGSRFRVILSFPCEPIGAESAPEWERRLDGVRVLLIEPNATTRSIVAGILRAHGMVPEEYATLDRALEPSIRAAYQCLIADANVLASTPWIPAVPVVRIASPLSPPSSDGVVVTRPVSERALIDAVGFVLQLTEAGKAYTLERRPDVVRPFRALVVGSNKVSQELVAEAVRRLGHIVTLAATVDDAIGLVTRRPFDVVFIDVQKGDVDGLGSARHLRAVLRDGRMPIVALSSSETADERDLCIEVGFDAVLRTPATPAAIGAIIREVTVSLLPASEESRDSDPILDAVGGNALVLRRVRDAFATQIPRLIGAIHDAIEAKDGEALARSARTLRGAIGNFDVPLGIAALIQIERAVAAADFVRAATFLPEIEAAIRELQVLIDAALG